MSVIGIIPARYGSTRFPGKPLADIRGKSMIQRVYEQASASKSLSEVLIATDDIRIADHARTFGGKVVITRPEHPSGTDRCFEAYNLNGKKFDHVINIQGDEPFLHPDQVNSIAGICSADTEIATQMTICKTYESLFDEGEVKIVLNTENEALYFSRSVIPFLKNKDRSEWHKNHTYYRHVGLYAYRTDILEKLCNLKPSSLEISESLEQLRWLEHGFKIKCVETNYDSHCIDSPADIEKVLQLMGIK